MVGGLRLPLLLLQSVVGLVLVIACANVAGLLLARSASRRTEIAVRSAIGAGRGRLVRQLLTESVMLAVIGGAAGLALGWLTLDRLVALSASFLPVLPAVVINARVLAFTFAVSVVTGLVFGALPALGASRPELAESLKSSARGSADAFARTRLRSGLTIAQIALAVMLLVVAGLTLRSLVALEKRDLGGDPDRVLRVTVPFTGLFRQVGSYKGYPLVEASPKVVPTIDGLLDRLQAVPGAASVAGASLPPFTAAGPLIPFEIEGRAPSAATNDQAGLTAAYQVVTRRFFSTMRIPLTAGREFDGRDVSTGPWGIVINAAMARQFWPNESPIGRRVRLDLTPDEQPREIIGVVSNHRNPYEATSQPSMFVLYSQQPPHTRGPSGMVMRNRMSFVIRTGGDPQGVAGAMRSAITDLDRDQPIAEVTSVHEDVMATVAPSRYIAIVLCVFAVVAVLLASVGLYGVMCYKVGQRTREIGVRMALGASRSDVQRLVMGQVLLLTLVGVLGGIAGAAGLLRAMNRLVSGVLVDVTAYDVPTYVGVSAVMIVVALLAGWVPARRALRVAPTIALRSE
jgi:putative ABC transport system permease protein